MKCEKCKEKEATFFYEESVNGETRAFHLCRNCAEKMKQSGELQFSMDEDMPFSFFPSVPNLLGGLFGLPTGTQKRSSGSKTCPGCGSCWADIASDGKVSCPLCYETFREELASTLRQVHGNVSHTGRAPAKRRAVNEKKQKLERCRKELRQAIETENFERAAQLRDEIKEMEGTEGGVQ